MGKGLLVWVAMLGFVLGLVVGVSGGSGCSVSEPLPSRSVPVSLDGGDGVVDEDDPGWDCRTMGNRVCGPGKRV